MKLYLLTVESCDYDEYDAILVRAEGANEAIDMVTKKDRDLDRRVDRIPTNKCLF